MTLSSHFHWNTYRLCIASKKRKRRHKCEQYGTVVVPRIEMKMECTSEMTAANDDKNICASSWNDRYEMANYEQHLNLAIDIIGSVVRSYRFHSAKAPSPLGARAHSQHTVRKWNEERMKAAARKKNWCKISRYNMYSCRISIALHHIIIYFLFFFLALILSFAQRYICASASVLHRGGKKIRQKSDKKIHIYTSPKKEPCAKFHVNFVVVVVVVVFFFVLSRMRLVWCLVETVVIYTFIYILSSLARNWLSTCFLWDSCFNCFRRNESKSYTQKVPKNSLDSTF